MLAHISFFNQTHVLVSFLLFHSIPSFSHWTENLKIDQLNYRQKWLVNGILFFTFSQLCLQPAFRAGPENLKIFFLVINIAGGQHILFQSFGFSMILSKVFKSSGLENLSRLQISEQIERFSVQTLFWSMTVMFILREFPQLSFYSLGKGIHFLISGLAVLGLLVSVFLLPKKLQLKKSLFIIRYLIFPLWPFSFVAILAGWLFHGVEYVIFSDIILKGSPGWNSERTKYTLLAFIGIQLIFCIPLVLMNIQHQWLNLLRHPGFVVIKGFVHTVILMHFYFDRFAYRKIYNPEGFKQSVLGTFGSYITS